MDDMIGDDGVPKLLVRANHDHSVALRPTKTEAMSSHGDPLYIARAQALLFGLQIRSMHLPGDFFTCCHESLQKTPNRVGRKAQARSNDGETSQE